ncbi:MAG: dihydrolipoamide acetyltransferase family protein [Myxococcota bacterium]
MAEKVVMPQLGESIAEGTIVKWLKQPGDAVKKDEDLLVISTDKVEAEIPAPATGVLVSIDVKEGDTVEVGTVLGYVGAAGEAGASPAASAPAAAAPAPAPAPAPVAVAPASAPAAPSVPSGNGAAGQAATESRPAGSSTQGRFVSPLVRRIAAEHDVSGAELDVISGTGNNGRVTKNDLLGYLETRGSAPASAPAAVAAAPVAPAPATVRAPAPPSVSIPAGARELVQPASSMRKVIMQNMVASKQTSAHVTTFFEVDFTRVEQVRKKHKDRFKAEEGVNLTFTTFVAAAVAQVLKRHPYINAEVRGTDIVFKKDVHLGMAVSIEQPEPGLMVPVIKHADQMNLRGLAHAITDLANRVRTKKIKPDELSGGSFTITNPGNYGAIIGTPIINQPQVAILGMGNIAKQPVVLEIDGTDVIAIRLRGVLSLSFDHRLIDGATADMFMADVKKTIEEWSTEP